MRAGGAAVGPGAGVVPWNVLVFSPTCTLSIRLRLAAGCAVCILYFPMFVPRTVCADGILTNLFNVDGFKVTVRTVMSYNNVTVTVMSVT